MIAHHFKATAAALILSLALISCTKKAGETSAQKSSKVVNLAIWSNYVTPEQLAEFEKRTGIKVQVSNYSSNEELLAKLQAGASGYDVVVPSDYMVFTMAKLGLLHEIDRSKLPQTKSLDPHYLKKPYDPENRYSLPYDWGTTGISVNRSLYKGQIRGWRDLFNDTSLAGKFSLLDDPRETIGAALKSLGFSLNSKDVNELKQAKELLIRVRGRVKAFNSETKMTLANGEIAVAHAYMTDALGARKVSGKDIDYFVPEEGGTFWIDNLVIPASAVHLAEAYQLMDFLLEPKNGVLSVTSLFVAPVSQETFRLLPVAIQRNPALFPPAEILKKCEMLEDLGEALSIWDRAWTEIKAQKD